VTGVAATSGGTKLFAAGNFGVYRSTDNGVSWSLVNNGLTDLRLFEILSPDGANLLAGGVGGVYLSTDDGDHWTSVSTGLTTGVSSLAMSADGQTLFAGTIGLGVWKRPLSEVMNITGVSAGFAPSVTLPRSYPNPFNPNATIQYSLLKTGLVRVSIYDVTGRLVRRLVDGIRSEGEQRVIWDGRNDHGFDVGSGVYTYRLESAGTAVAGKMTLLK
jgi:hypothetical protein